MHSALPESGRQAQRQTAKRLFVIVLVAATLPAMASSLQKPPRVHGQGCVEAGAEANCLVVRDLKNGNLYNLLFKGMQPALGTGIEFTGAPHNGVTTCMQGTAVDVQAWRHKDALKCVQEVPPTKWH